MSKNGEQSDASRRLADALKAMEDAVAARRKADLTIESLQEQVQTLTADLEEERRRNEKLSAATDDVSERLDKVSGTIEDILKNG